MAFLREIGLGGNDVIVKSDQEEAIKALVTDVARLRIGPRTIPEEAPKGSSGSKGIIERAVQGIEGLKDH